MEDKNRLHSAKMKKHCILIGFVLVCSMVATQSSMTVQHVVGGDTGWSNVGFNYTRWAASNIFYVGDTLLFNYIPLDHTVLQVEHESFRECNLSTPIKSYMDGKTDVPLKNAGSYYFVCGVGDHCLEGQKIEVQVHQSIEDSLNAPSSLQQDSGVSLSLVRPWQGWCYSFVSKFWLSISISLCLLFYVTS
eukprot:c34385_g1_i1 orf=358-927(-)